MSVRSLLPTSDRHHGRERFDVAALRCADPVETVVAQSRVELSQRGQGFVAAALPRLTKPDARSGHTTSSQNLTTCRSPARPSSSRKRP